MSTPTWSISVDRKADAVLLCILLSTGGLVGIVKAQSMPEKGERFEVASIRPSDAKDERPSIAFNPGGGVRARNVTLKLLIEAAYDIRPEQLSGGPGWTDSAEYTVIAKGPEGGTVLSQGTQLEVTRKRLQALLSERFHLILRLEANRAAGYVLRVDKKGHRMTPATETTVHRLRQRGRWALLGEGVDMALLARFLSVHLQGSVEDGTGLEGFYSFNLTWPPEAPIDWSVNMPEESLISAVQEQLGLRLERQKVATDHYTIQRAEKPSEN